MSDFEFLRYFHLIIFSAWVVSFVSLVVVVVHDRIKKHK